MPDTTHEEIVVQASPSMCFGIAADFEEYPMWASDVKSVAVRERDTTGRATRVEYRAAALGRAIRYVLDYDFTDAPRAFSWSLVEGDLVRTIDGRYAFTTEGSGTRVAYDLHIDLTMPVPGMVKRAAAARITGAALADLKRVAESGRA
jgi:ribosome-associated toxin RatA of RatAB toxin-antitoxin module